MSALGAALRALACAVALTAAPACHLFQPPESKVKNGELFETAHPKYDPYFQEVNALQKAVADWEEKKASVRRPLVDALKLDPDVADVTLVQATHERMLGVVREAGTIRLDVVDGQGRVVVQNPTKIDEGTRAFFAVVEACVRAEIDRGKSLRDLPARVDAAAQTGRALRIQAREDFQRRGSHAARQVEDELTASFEALGDVGKAARLLSREAEDFVADLRRAVGSEGAEAAARPSLVAKKAPKKGEGKDGKGEKSDGKGDGKESRPADAPKPKVDAPPKPKPAEEKAPEKPAEKAPEKPVEAPKPKPAEDFNP